MLFEKQEWKDAIQCMWVSMATDQPFVEMVEPPWLQTSRGLLKFCSAASETPIRFCFAFNGKFNKPSSCLNPFSKSCLQSDFFFV